MSQFLIIFISLALLSKCQADMISDFCSKTNNPSLCNQVVRSDPRSRVANARGLAKIALANAESATRASVNVARSVSDPNNKQIIDTCIDVFNMASDILKRCEGLIQKADRSSINDLKTDGTAAQTFVTTCSDEFEVIERKEPPALEQATAKATTFIRLLLVIAKTF